MASSSPKEHQQHIQEAFRLDYFGLKTNDQKCIFDVPSIEFLGHQIGKTGITLLLSKTEAIKNILAPTSLKQLRRFINIVCYYSRFIPKCSHIQVELTDILESKDKDTNFNEKSLEAFNTAKQSIVNYTKWNYINSDSSFH